MKGIVKVLTFALMAWFLMGTVAPAQSLAEAAKKAKEKQKTEQRTAKKVYTNEDLSSKSATEKETSISSNATETSQSLQPVEETQAPSSLEDSGKAKQEWLDQYRTLKAKTFQLKRKIQDLDAQINTLTTGFMASDFPDQTQALRDEIQKRREEQQNAREELAQTEQALNRLMRDARGAGVLPGDFRKVDRELEKQNRDQS